MIILIIGKNCSGKTFFREYVGDKNNIITYEASDYIKKAKQKYSINSTRELLDIIGDDFAAREICNLIELRNESNDDIIISGFRTLQEVDYINNKFGQENIKIVMLIANDILCYIRNIKRNREDKKIRYKDFKIRQEDDEKLGIRRILEKYDIVAITNNLSIRRFKNNIDRFMDSVSKRSNQASRNKSFRESMSINVNSLNVNVENDVQYKTNDLTIEK